VLDWHGDHLFTNYHKLLNYLRFVMGARGEGGTPDAGCRRSPTLQFLEHGKKERVGLASRQLLAMQGRTGNAKWGWQAGSCWSLMLALKRRGPTIQVLPLPELPPQSLIMIHY